MTEFPTETTSGSGGNTTTLDWTPYSSSLTPLGLRITHPAVSTSKNGSGSATKGYMHFTTEGLVDWQKDPSGVVTYKEYSRGQLAKHIQDADTDLSSSGQDFHTVSRGFAGGYRRRPMRKRTEFAIPGQDRTRRPEDRLRVRARTATPGGDRLADQHLPVARRDTRGPRDRGMIRSLPDLR